MAYNIWYGRAEPPRIKLYRVPPPPPPSQDKRMHVWGLQRSLWSFLQPLLKLWLIPDFLVQCSGTRKTFQDIRYLWLAFCNIAVEEREEADVRKAQLSRRKGRKKNSHSFKKLGLLRVKV